MNTLQILVMGDNHGDVESLQRVVEATEGDEFDFIIHTGDITNTSKSGFQTGITQLRSLEPHFEVLAERAELIYIYGNRDRESRRAADQRHITEAFELGPGHRLRHGEAIEVAGQQFTADPDTAGQDDILVTHIDSQRDFYRGAAKAYFCGHSHRARQFGRSLNTGYLWKEEYTHGSYFVVEIGDSGLSVDVRGLTEPWEEKVCPDHGWYGTQFVATGSGCRICEEGPERQFRKMVTEAFVKAVGSPTENQTSTVEEIVVEARTLFVDTEQYESQVTDYLETLHEKDTLAPKDPLRPTGDGRLTLRTSTDRSC